MNMGIEQAINARRTCRGYTNKMPDADVIHEVLDIAQRSPSSTNIQPWDVTIATGEALQKLRTRLAEDFDKAVPLDMPSLPESHHHFRQQLGREIYGPDGYNMLRSEVERHASLNRRNFEMYDAPMVAVIGIDERLNYGDVVSVGMYLQTLVLLLTERGLATGCSVATSGYHKQIREILGVAENVKVLCTLQIGYEDESVQVNKLKMSRRNYTECVKFVEQPL